MCSSDLQTINDNAGWRGWVFSTVPEQRRDFAVAPLERNSTLGAFVTYPVTDAIDAGVRFDRTTDVLGEPQGRSALFVVRVPLFGSPAPQESRSTAYAEPRASSSRPTQDPGPEADGNAEPGLVARLLDPATYWHALRLDVPLRWVLGAPESPSDLSLPSLRPPAAP